MTAYQVKQMETLLMALKCVVIQLASVADCPEYESKGGTPSKHGGDRDERQYGENTHA